MYKLKLPNFEGPFDLLLYFIKRDELNIYDIPISRITKEFLKYIRLMKYFDLELAGEFIVMAATLMYIKTQMLLPREESEESGEAEDPRTQLVQRLLEYKKFKEAAYNLQEFEDNQKYIHYRKMFDIDQKMVEDNSQNSYANATLFDLLKAFRKVMDKKEKIPDAQHVVNLFPITVEEKSKEMLDYLNKKKRIVFSQYLNYASRPVIVITFLTILDLIRKQLIYCQQEEAFDDLIISLMPEYSLN
jgi:segregation and condensation protein A